MPCNLEPSTKRHKAQARIALLFVLIALALTVLPTASFAGTDTAGNVLATEAGSNPSGVAGDLYWAGQSLNLDDASIGRDIIAAGDSLSIRDCTVGGAIRLAARTIDISKTAIDGSVTVAGQHVVLNTGSTANCFYAMGDTVALRGSTKSAALAGDTVTIDGTVEGDVEVWADKLVLGKNARITGTVSAHVSEDPERAEGAQVGALKIDRTENENTSTINDTIGGIVAAALSTCFVAILLELVFPRATASAAGMLRQRLPSVGERSFGHGGRRSRRPVAHHLDCRSVTRRSSHVRRDRYRSGLGGVYGHRDRTHDRTQPEPLRHGRRGRYRRGRTHGTSPYGSFVSGVASSLRSATSSRSSGATPASSRSRPPILRAFLPPSRQPPQRGQTPLRWCRPTQSLCTKKGTDRDGRRPFLLVAIKLGAYLLT